MGRGEGVESWPDAEIVSYCMHTKLCPGGGGGTNHTHSPGLPLPRERYWPINGVFTCLRDLKHKVAIIITKYMYFETSAFLSPEAAWGVEQTHTRRWTSVCVCVTNSLLLKSLNQLECIM